MSKEPSGWLTSVQSFIWFCITVAALTWVWGVGVAAVRRYSISSSSSSSSSGAFTASSTVLSPGNLGGEGGGGMLGAKEYVKENVPEKSQRTFKDVKGCDEAIVELKEVVDYLKHPGTEIKCACACACARRRWTFRGADG